MKRFGLLLFLVLVISCTKEKPIDYSSEIRVVAEIAQPVSHTKSSLDNLSIKWLKGDRIVLYDENGDNAVYEAVSSGTATEFLLIKGKANLSSNVYAYYPAENVKSFDKNSKTFSVIVPDSQRYEENGIVSGVCPMIANTIVKDGTISLSFKNVFSILKLNVVGDGEVIDNITLENNCPICGVMDVKINSFGNIESVVTGKNKITISQCNVQLSGVSKSFYLMVPAGDEQIYSLQFGTIKDGISCTYIKNRTSSIDITRNTLYCFNEMGLGSTSAKDVKSKANCYMVNLDKSSVISIPLSQVIDGWKAIADLGETDIVSQITDALAAGENMSVNTRWYDGATGEINMTLAKSNNTAYDILSCQFINCKNGSNAAIDLIYEGTVIWSWHFWFTNYEPSIVPANTTNGQVHDYGTIAFQSGGFYNGKVMMDRNLGAIYLQNGDASILQPFDDAVAKSLFGLYFQYGRKDPFSSLTGYLSPSPIDVKDNRKQYTEAINNPNLFYYVRDNKYGEGGTSWSSTDYNATSLVDPWNSSSDKSAFDPCPAGWRLPVTDMNDDKKCMWKGVLTIRCKNRLNTLYTAGNIVKNSESEQIGWYPASGIRNCSAEPIYWGTIVACWSSTPKNNGASNMLYSTDGNFRPGTFGYSPRHNGIPVRCVSE